MMALHILPLLQVILAFQTTSILSYPNPIYGTKRYGRSAQAQQHRIPSYDPYSYQNVRRYPVGYYKPNPYAQAYPESYFYPQQESYPMYYAPARTSKYEIYQAVLPYYYQETPLPRQAYSGYYDYNDPMVDVQDEMLQEAEREEREETQPIGHESYYENDGDNFVDEANVDDINAAFLQNLILTQMYQDSLGNNIKTPEVYGDYEDQVPSDLDMNQQPARVSEDETVRELKQLQKANRKDQYRMRDNNNKSGDKHWTQQNQEKNQEKKQRRNRQRKQKQDDKRTDSYSNEILFSPEDIMVYYDKKPVKTGTTVAPSTSTTEVPDRESRGQKEVFQMRPATPVRNPFASPVLSMLPNDGERKRTLSVVDTIKRLLDMEKSMEKSQAENEMRPSMKKRIITPEENLTRQLTVLKKAQ